MSDIHPAPADDLFDRIPYQSCTDRVRWITNKCRGKNVLDIGCLDETAFLVKKEGSNWLHGEISACCKGIVGIDSSPRLAALKEQYPDKLRNILYGMMQDAPRLMAELNFTPDVIVCGELIEHLDRPALLFEALAPIVRQYDAELILTTPNPYGYQMILMALLRMESQHIDHQCLLSPKILMRLGRRFGLELSEIRTSFTRYDEFMARPGPLKYALGVADFAVFRPAQMVFPGIGGGLLVAFRRASN